MTNLTSGSPNDPWMKYEDPPGASAEKIYLETSGDHSGWATYPLAKAHGKQLTLRKIAI